MLTWKIDLEGRVLQRTTELQDTAKKLPSYPKSYDYDPITDLDNFPIVGIDKINIFGGNTLTNLDSVHIKIDPQYGLDVLTEGFYFTNTCNCSQLRLVPIEKKGASPTGHILMGKFPLDWLSQNTFRTQKGKINQLSLFGYGKLSV